MTLESGIAYVQLMLSYVKVELTMEVPVQVVVLGLEVVRVVVFRVNQLVLRQVLTQAV